MSLNTGCCEHARKICRDLAQKNWLRISKHIELWRIPRIRGGMSTDESRMHEENVVNELNKQKINSWRQKKDVTYLCSSFQTGRSFFTSSLSDLFLPSLRPPVSVWKSGSCSCVRQVCSHAPFPALPPPPPSVPLSLVSLPRPTRLVVYKGTEGREELQCVWHPFPSLTKGVPSLYSSLNVLRRRGPIVSKTHSVFCPHSVKFNVHAQMWYS